MLENTSVSTTTETTAAVTTEPAVVSAPSVDTTLTPASTEVAPYVPSDFKFKYTGKNGEKWGDAEGEIDEPVRGLIKTKEDEEKWKKFYSKVHGFDFIVDGREKARTELTQYKNQASPILKYAQEATRHYNNKDYRSFFETLGVPNDVLKQYVYSQLQHEELPEAQRNVIEQNRTLARQVEQMKEQLESFQQNNFHSQRETVYNELQAELSKSDIKAIADAFDARLGQPGRFSEEIRQRGENIYLTQNGRIAKPSELIQDFIKTYGLQAQAAPAPQSPSSTTVPAQLSTEKPTIPVVQGGGASPSHRTVNSLGDLAAIRKEKYGY